MQEVLSYAGSTSYEGKLAVHMLVRLVFQLNDLNMKSLFPPFLSTLNIHVCTCKNALGW